MSRSSKRRTKGKKTFAGGAKGRIDHDGLFKELIERFFLAFMEFFFPDIARDIDSDSIKPLDKETRRGKTLIGDLLVEVKLRSLQEKILVHIEFQSTRNTKYPQKMYRYFTRYHEKYGLPVLSIVVYTHDCKQKEECHYILRLYQTILLAFRFYPIQLSLEFWRNYLANPNPVAAALITLMNYTEDDKVEVKIEFYKMFEQLDLDEEEGNFLISFMETYLVLSEEQEAMFDKLIIKEEVPKTMERITSFERKGYQRGFADCEKKGKKRWYKRGFRRGQKRGTTHGIEIVAVNMLNMGESLDKITQATGLSRERIRSLKS